MIHEVNRKPLVGLVSVLGLMLLAGLWYAQVHRARQSAPRVGAEPAATGGTSAVDDPASFVGGASCRPCHVEVCDRWAGSDHDLAMQEADSVSVLGDFDDARFEGAGVVVRFFRRDGRYWVNAEGPDGAPHDYEVAYTFGVRPLQQYLIRFPGGRLQCLNVAWDVAERRWYSLYPEQTIEPDEWLHWTRGAMNWNGMCAECHSTNLRKGYDPEHDTYATTWSEIDVSCESCHGPASRHVAWASAPSHRQRRTSSAGFDFSISSMSARQEVDWCARCHARRSLLTDLAAVPGPDLLDQLVPATLEEGLYFPDGQIQDEVFEYGAFVQSKMFRRGVRCTDCHDPHSTGRLESGNTLCARCHTPERFDGPQHHFHDAIGPGGARGPLCVDCHMPRRTYMGIDARADHSLRIPRPDLTVQLGVPNACAQAGCHADQSAQWAAEAAARWWGSQQLPHYGQVLAAARAGETAAAGDLMQLARDDSTAVIVRATAVSLLDRYPSDLVRDAVVAGLHDRESLVRRAAIGQTALLPPGQRRQELTALLRDPVLGVRIEAARASAELLGAVADPADSSSFWAAVRAYEEAARYQLDLAGSGYNLGNLQAALGRTGDAERSYRAALRVDPAFAPARVHYGLLLNGMGRNEEAEAQLQASVQDAPELYQNWFNLGLLLGEQNRPAEAARALERAVALAPSVARARYNLGLAYREANRIDDARTALTAALDLEGSDADCLWALTDLELRSGNRARAGKLIARWLEQFPDDPRARQLQMVVSGQAALPKR